MVFLLARGCVRETAMGNRGNSGGSRGRRFLAAGGAASCFSINLFENALVKTEMNVDLSSYILIILFLLAACRLVPNYLLLSPIYFLHYISFF